MFTKERNPYKYNVSNSNYSKSSSMNSNIYASYSEDWDEYREEELLRDTSKEEGAN